VLLLLLAAGGGAAAWYWWLHRAVDWNEVLTTHNRAVGLMDQFNYQEAVSAFEKVVKLAPDWLPARINLGIALLNRGSDDPEALKKTQEVFEEVLRRDPDNPYGHFCLGILNVNAQNSKIAADHFQAVLHKDPNDCYSWYWLGKVSDDPDFQAECYTKALKLQPALNAAVYGMAQLLLRQGKQQEAKDLIDKFKKFDTTGTGIQALVKYTNMGTYAEVIGRRAEMGPPVIGRLPLFGPHEVKVDLAPGASWARAADFGNDTLGKLRTRLRRRFGAALAVFDFNRDGKPDLFLVGAVVEKGHVRDLLLRNDGNGHFTDVTAAAGLAAPHPTLGCAAADWNNDGTLDLVLTGAGSQKLYRNKGDGTFEDVTAKAGLDKLKSVCLGAQWVDLDQDADLDLLIAEFAPTPEAALKALDGDAAAGGLAVYLNTGEAPVARPDMQPPPLSGTFERVTNLGALHGTAGRVTSAAVSDLDGDGDVDVVVFTDASVPAVAVNDRLLHFRRQTFSDALAPAQKWNGAVVLHADHNDRSDLLLLPAGQPPRLLLNRHQPGVDPADQWFESGPITSPPLLQAVVTDIDLDGRADVVGLSAEGLPVLLRNEGGKLAAVREAFAPPDDLPKDLVALAVGDFAGHHRPDLVAWSESKGLLLFENLGNGSHGLWVDPVGRNLVSKFGNQLRCNNDGIGVKLAAQRGEHWAGQENTTLNAGLGQSRQPVLLGLREAMSADVVRLRWPDGAWQGELDVRADIVMRIPQDNRKPTSCPVLFTWDGQRFVFVTDFLGAGSVGELGPDGSCRPPRPEESIKIEPHQLAPRDGRLTLEFAEPMDEVTHLDRIQLIAIDHPAGVKVYPDERFATAGPGLTQDLIAFDKEIFPVTARDHRGHDLTEALRRWDRITADGFARRSWQGFAEEHFVDLDFADRLAQVKPGERLFLCLAGWTDYATPASIWAAHQAGIAMKPPVLERQKEDGRWETVREAGFPAGLPRMMLLDVTGKLTGPCCRLRLRTNLNVYWDQIFVAAGCRTVVPGAKEGLRATVLEVSAAALESCGIMQEFSPDGREPTLYDHDRYDRTPVAPPAGKRTRFGDVTELLREKDDCFVVFGPGDKVTAHFDAGRLPPLPAGWVRSYVLRTWGYCKDSSPFTAHGATIEPLPFAAMSNYPPGPDEHYPSDAMHQDYLQRYQTREVSSPAAPGRRR
jgi:hypothetical protein